MSKTFWAPISGVRFYVDKAELLPSRTYKKRQDDLNFKTFISLSC